ncbi:Rv2578c family radical SAM protein [Glaciihabitans sp. dw_435]|uniref:Rv2578c family radical SAM protein n=1 Tax=Glaciihabitans sp. dw_435 TaxID=2720081 RepID=UPI001BD5FC61|nr:Rv2578c family radical SAM protein [Glaciihabitans sp. dw_435]
MRWNQQELTTPTVQALPGLARLNNLVRTVRTPDFAGVTFHEILAKTALNHVPGASQAMPHAWTINPYRGCQHACTYCFARNTHTYLDLDAGKDFDSEIIVKVNVAEVVAKELRTKGDQVPAVSLGTNTDPYQRAEGRYKLMPGIIDALVKARKPLSILTKGTLLRRDLDLLASASREVPVDIAMSIAIYDDALQQSVEPGTPSTTARLATVKAVRDHNMDCTVFLMPVLPYITDTKEHLDHALALVKESGASSVIYTALHLRPGAKEWYMLWLQQERPELVAKYEEMYAKSAYGPVGYRKWLAARIEPLIRAHGLHKGIENPATGGVRNSAVASVASPQPMLF